MRRSRRARPQQSPNLIGRALAILPVLAGCTVSTTAYPVFEKSGIVARGAEEEGVYARSLRGDEVFSLVGTDRFAGRTPAFPEFCIQLNPAAPPTRADALAPGFVLRWLSRWTPTDEERARGLSESPYPGELVYVGKSCVLGFDANDGHLRWITVGDTTPSVHASDSPGPRIGPPSCDRLYPLPLTRAQLIEIFGEPQWEGWQRGPENLLVLF